MVKEVEVVKEVFNYTPKGQLPAGNELAKHTHEGAVYTLVEYGDRVSVFSASREPVTNPNLASDVLRSYSWGVSLAKLDVDGLAADVRQARALSDSLSEARTASNDMVSLFDRLNGISANVPLLGEVSALDALRAAFSEVNAAEALIRRLDSHTQAGF